MKRLFLTRFLSALGSLIFLFCGVFFFASAENELESQNSKYLPNMLEYFENNEETAHLFLFQNAEKGIFTLSELKKKANKYVELKENREKMLEEIAQKYFSNNIDYVLEKESAFQEEFLLEYEEENDEKPSLFLFHVPSSKLKDFYKEIAAYEHDKKEFLEKISALYFENNFEKAEEFLETQKLYAEERLLQKEEERAEENDETLNDEEKEEIRLRTVYPTFLALEKTLAVEEENEDLILHIAEKYFYDEIEDAKEFVRRARREGIHYPKSWEKLAKKEYLLSSNLEGNLTNLARIYFKKDREALNEFIEEEKEEGRETVVEWANTLRLNRVDEKIREEHREIIFERYMYKNKEKAEKFFALQDDDEMMDLKQLKKDALIFWREKNKEDNVKIEDEQEKEVQEYALLTYFDPIEGRDVSEEYLEKREADIEAFYEDDAKMAMARARLKLDLQEAEEKKAEEDRLLRIKDEAKMVIEFFFTKYHAIPEALEEDLFRAFLTRDIELFRTLYTEEAVSLQEFEDLSVLMRIEDKEVFILEFNLYKERSRYTKEVEPEQKKERILYALQKKDFNMFRRETGGKFNGRELTYDDFLVFVELHLSEQSGDENAKKLAEKKLEKFESAHKQLSRKRKLRRYLFQENFEKFHKNLYSNLQEKISEAQFSLLISIAYNYKNNEFSEIVEKQKLLGLSQDEWKYLRDILR